MTGIDIQTLDLANIRNGVAFAAYAYEQWGDDYPVSGDTLAQVRSGIAAVEEVASGGPDCGA